MWPYFYFDILRLILTIWRFFIDLLLKSTAKENIKSKSSNFVINLFTTNFNIKFYVFTTDIIYVFLKFSGQKAITPLHISNWYFLTTDTGSVDCAMRRENMAKISKKAKYFSIFLRFQTVSRCQRAPYSFSTKRSFSEGKATVAWTNRSLLSSAEVMKAWSFVAFPSILPSHAEGRFHFIVNSVILT